MSLYCEGVWRIFEDRLPIGIYGGYSFLWPGKCEWCVPSDTNIRGTSVSPTLSIDLTSITMLLSSSISRYPRLPPPVRNVHLGTEAFRWRIAVNATPKGVNEMLGVGRVPHQPSHTFDDVSTPVFDRVLVIVIPSHIFQSV